MSLTAIDTAPPPVDHLRDDRLLQYWLRQVQLRLRRELAWCWFQRSGQRDPGNGVLPPPDDPLAEGAHWVFDRVRREWFFGHDAQARELSTAIAAEPPREEGAARRGGFSWICHRLQLDAAARFALALALAHRLDSSIGPLCASCMNDLSRPFPSLALAQRLWHQPERLAAVAGPLHPLWRTGLLERPETAAQGWLHPLQPSPLVLDAIGSDQLPPGLLPAGPVRPRPVPRRPLWEARLALEGQAPLPVPLVAPADADHAAWAARLGELAGRTVVVVTASCLQHCGAAAVATWAWLRGVDLLLPAGMEEAWREMAGLTLPLRLFLPVTGGVTGEAVPDGATPPFHLPVPGFRERLQLLQQGLPEVDGGMAQALEECARRFRLPEQRLVRLTRQLGGCAELTPELLVAACRDESGSDLERLTQRVVPRFRLDDLVVPADLRRQLDELRRAARSLTRVHYHWGTARAWNEGGLAALFHGPPGTGKTMAAEALAADLGLEMYRIDLARVVSKYVGETEKNLARIFDAADACDCLLLFDEADAIFGRRTEVKDAHDRYANIEISYLLERMERFKGVAVLASNRRRDLDDAFLRRLRWTLAFPLPDAGQREEIWRRGFPPAVDTAGLDFRFLARQFPLSGGHIKSVAFNSCLQAAADPRAEPAPGRAGRPTMGQVLLQVKRELQKLERSCGPEQFGSYAGLLEEES
ncbi:MAG TPA: ATP-binding protein [Sedimenticola thiotaurini]|uniref:ATP-binding protein n=1 Tax=Sedimenticola thiotaurini TaxID=1543721 RepID=A0A831RQP5_9GAMM|nr:ATP-binding protein [Sedimenticola thiotaurini]